MDLTTQTPVEIDTQIAEIYVRAYVQRGEVERTLGYLESDEKRVEQMEAGTYRYFFTERDLTETKARVEGLRAKAADQRDVLTAIWAEAKPFNAEWVRRGRWSRYFLVDNGSGHVHSSIDCSTTYPTTQWVWLPEYSDQDEAGVVALAKSQACTVCFPSAPVTREKGSIMSPAKRKSAQERAEAKAARDAAKAAKAIANADGSPLVVFDHHWSARTIQERDGSTRVIPARDTFETITTLAAAKMWLTDSQEAWRASNKRAEDVQAVADAIAHKVGTTAADEIAAAAKRAAKRK